jgi:DNA (cytosine-5)-methyltransferase 1
VTAKLKVLDLFSGIGGFSLGLERTGGFETVAFCEIDPFCRKVLKMHWPEVEIHNDVTNLEFRKNVDLVTAGFPCQDISLAGEGAGITGDRSGLFWYILRTLCMVGRPRSLLENVAGLLTRGLGEVLGALASFGYDAEWHCLPASYVGAWHERDRVWIYADPGDERLQGVHKEPILRKSSLSQQLSGVFEEWPGRSNLPESRFHRKGDGIPDVSHRLKALGNAVVPQIPEIIGHAILAAEAA